MRILNVQILLLACSSETLENGEGNCLRFLSKAWPRDNGTSLPLFPWGFKGEVFL